MNPLIRPISSLFALVILHSAAWAGEPVTLKQQWQIGKKYFQNMKMDQETKMSMGGRSMDQKVSMSTGMTLTVTRHENPELKRIGIKYLRMAMNADMGGQKIRFDSDEPGDSAKSPFAAMIGKELRLITDASGQVTDFENFEDLVKSAGGNPMAAAALNKEAILQVIRQNGLMSTPAKPIQPGDSWPFEVEVPLPQIGKILVKGTYVFQRVSEHGGVECLEITFNGTLAADMAGAAADSPAAKLGMKVEDGVLKGTLWFDNALGATRETQLTQEMTMTMSNPMKAGETIRIPTRQTVNSAITKVESVP